MSPKDSNGWVTLTEGKQLSRLLYTNPVCFLCCSTSSSAVEHERNVMVISWLTATNNHGDFVFSINRQRHTASMLQRNLDDSTGGKPQSAEFCLCVPTVGMEGLVRNVGSVSGGNNNNAKYSKFPAQRTPSSTTTTVAASVDASGASTTTGTNIDSRPLSKRQRKKLPRFPDGVPNLDTLPFGDRLFAIQGTVAHLQCHLKRLVEGITDDEHYLGVAQVVSARVDARYFDTQKNLFQPLCKGAPPYMTFFGSRTFGAVLCITDRDTNEDDESKQEG